MPTVSLQSRNTRSDKPSVCRSGDSSAFPPSAPSSGPGLKGRGGVGGWGGNRRSLVATGSTVSIKLVVVTWWLRGILLTDRKKTAADFINFGSNERRSINGS